MSHERLFVVVPFYNEEHGISATLNALSEQDDNEFTLLMVDNGSTDASAAIVNQFAKDHPSLRIRMICESQKGTGAASDTGFRAAILQGADWIARTDADCVPAPDWTRNIKAALRDEGLEFVAGKILPRTDEEPLTTGRKIMLSTMLWLAESYGKIHRRGSKFKYPYFMAAGNNLAITASLYERSGGFLRSRLEDLNEDRALSEAVRTITSRGGLRKNILVRNSIRRVRAYGALNTLRWYRNRGYRPAEVDIR
ncbi:MAG: glycosyltransferase [Gammaproteobacteria bacterium]|nr:glycosyltransferase [Gammaproteobacteria bacterium]